MDFVKPKGALFPHTRTFHLPVRQEAGLFGNTKTSLPSKAIPMDAALTVLRLGCEAGVLSASALPAFNGDQVEFQEVVSSLARRALKDIGQALEDLHCSTILNCPLMDWDKELRGYEKESGERDISTKTLLARRLGGNTYQNFGLLVGEWGVSLALEDLVFITPETGLGLEGTNSVLLTLNRLISAFYDGEIDLRTITATDHSLGGEINPDGIGISDDQAEHFATDIASLDDETLDLILESEGALPDWIAEKYDLQELGEDFFMGAMHQIHEMGLVETVQQACAAPLVSKARKELMYFTDPVLDLGLEKWIASNVTMTDQDFQDFVYQNENPDNLGNAFVEICMGYDALSPNLPDHITKWAYEHDYCLVNELFRFSMETGDEDQRAMPIGADVHFSHLAEFARRMALIDTLGYLSSTDMESLIF